MIKNYIPLDQCVDKHLYKIGSRNLRLGVFVAETAGFVGIREKYDQTYLFTEYHYDIGPPFGTVVPRKDLGECPIPNHDDEDNAALFDWLIQKEKEFPL